MHGVFWVDGAPDVSKLESESEEKLSEVLDYFSGLICAVNPNPDVASPDSHPCRRDYNLITDFEEDLSQLLNEVQRHTRCSPRYCIRNNKCRYKFPREMQENSTLQKNEEKQEFEFLPARNDPLLNKFNKFMIQLWRANMDISPVISKRALVAYLTKYISKCEVSSPAYESILQSIMKTVDEDTQAKKVIQKLYMKSCAERDISAQEVCHSLSGCKLYNAGGRKFINISFSKLEWVPIDNEDEHENSKQNVFEKYKNRPENLEDMSLHKCVRKYNMRTWTKVKKENILCIYPSYKKENGEIFFRQQCLLHLPWREETQFITNDNEEWEHVYLASGIGTDHEQRQLDFNGGEDEDEQCDDDLDYINDDDGEIEEWMAASMLGPRCKLPNIDLGNRQEDLEYDWTKSYDNYKQYGSINVFAGFIETKKKDEVNTIKTTKNMNVKLSREQQMVINTVKEQIRALQGNIDKPEDMVKRIIVQGKAGTFHFSLIL